MLKKKNNNNQDMDLFQDQSGGKESREWMRGGRGREIEKCEGSVSNLQEMLE